MVIYDRHDEPGEEAPEKVVVTGLPDEVGGRLFLRAVAGGCVVEGDVPGCPAGALRLDQRFDQRQDGFGGYLSC